MKQIILASNSPRRKQLLEQIGFDPIVLPSKYVEKNNLPPKLQVLDNAKGKAEWISKRFEGDSLIIAADTIVTVDNIILGKPKDKQKAKEMLEILRGKAHLVLTAIYLFDILTKRVEKDIIETIVYMRDFSNNELINYINTKEPYDKAGGYAIQGKASIFVTEIKGSYSNVVGLPLAELANLLSKFNIEVSNKW
ncbi:MAG: Maf family protein [Clostridia bacterium]